jgi:hypothetical protein
MIRLSGTFNPEKLAYLGIHYLDHPPYSPELVPSEYHLFTGLKKTIDISSFSCEAEVIAAAKFWLERKRSKFF